MTLREIPIRSVWSALGGSPLRGRRGKAFWRGGDGLTVSVDFTRNTWHDFRDNIGGGVLWLVETVLGCDRSAALSWLEQNCNLDWRRRLSCEERLQHDRIKSLAAPWARDIEYWRKSFIEQLDSRKITACEVGDWDALECAASLCNTLENGTAAAIISEFKRYCEIDPDRVKRLIAAGKEREIDSQEIAARVVLLLVTAQSGGAHA